MLRIFKLAKSWKKFQELLETIANTLKDISIFTILLFLFIFIYTLLGLELFAFTCAKTPDDKIDKVNGIVPQSNFNTFRDSFVTVFILLTGDSWTAILFDYYRCNGPAISVITITLLISLAYFISFLVIG